ncbi:MAG: MATE family efflux transporter [Lachnospiraceae bacterium]|nr:MATE family efflux transporter [Lachnospiraceae bacterium]
MTLKTKYFGDKAFYRRIFLVMLPIMIQNAITNFVNMLDNLMVGRLGTEEMSGVSIANTLIFVYNLSVFGAVSGAGIFTAQYHGKEDAEGVRNCFRFKLMIAVTLAALACTLLLTKGDVLVSLYLQGEGDPAEAAKILQFARDYIAVIVIGLIPSAIAQAFSSTLRETDNGVPPMVAGLIAVGVNLILNYILIFGHFGAPRLGVVGAAAATVASRFVELGIVSVWTFRNKKKAPFIVGAFRSLHVPRQLSREIVKKGFPLMLNETIWAAGVAYLDKCYTTRGLDVVPACNISNTFFHVMAVAIISAGSAIGIIIGQKLGAGQTEEAKEDAPRMLVFSVLLGVAVGILYAGVAFIAPQLYNTTDSVKHLATQFLLVTAVFMPIEGPLNVSYFLVRSGGKTLITMFTDCGLLWLVQGTTAFFLSEFTNIPVIPLFALVEAGMIVKLAVSLLFVANGKWAHSVVEEDLTEDRLPSSADA